MKPAQESQKPVMGQVELLEMLCELFPTFNARWLDEDNLFRIGDDYTAHGICACFSHHFAEDLHNQADEALAKLFASIEAVIAGDEEGIDSTANAIHTCFLENLAGTVAGERARQFKGEASRRYFDAWVYSNEEVMDWMPITQAELSANIRAAEARMEPQVSRLWNAIKVSPAKWSEKTYGTVGGGFWVVAIIGSKAIGYNDIEGGFNFSSCELPGTLAEYFCNQDALEVAVQNVF